MLYSTVSYFGSVTECIMGEPSSPDRVFDFPMDEPEAHLTYDFFALGPLPGAEVDKPTVDPVIEEIAEPDVEVEEQVVAPVMDMEEDLAMLFGDDNSSDDSLDDEEVWEVNAEWLMAPVTPPPMPVMPLPSTYEVGGSSTYAIEEQSFTLPAPGFYVHPSVIKDLCTRMSNLKYGHRKLAKKVIKASDAEMADGIAIGEIGPRVFAVKGKVHAMASQMVQAVVD
uniref:Uncharacterized protein n=1 Tax=Tanacetum cinerariifolium TaxID=118510 RepID=A0A6L2JVA3_TANCI|nr:hypothetical protein [Tanacetum cinerariifolium]